MFIVWCRYKSSQLHANWHQHYLLWMCSATNWIQRRKSSWIFGQPSSITPPHKSNTTTAQQKVSKLQELRLEVLRDPPYWLDFTTRKFYFFQSSDNFVVGKKLNTWEVVQNALKEFVGSLIPKFLKKDIEKLHCADRDALIPQVNTYILFGLIKINIIKKHLNFLYT